jgi:hypothetical protein
MKPVYEKLITRIVVLPLVALLVLLLFNAICTWGIILDYDGGFEDSGTWILENIYTGGFVTMSLGEDIEKAMIRRIPFIAQKMAAGLAVRAANYTAKINAGKDVDLIIGLPTPPTGGIAARYIPVGRNIKLQIGGRATKMIGLGVMIGNNRNNVDPLVRIDYFDTRPSYYGLHIHYHLFGEGHPLKADRTIWRPYAGYW